MNLEYTEQGGGYFIYINESNQSVYVSLATGNDVIRTDDENPYYFSDELWNDKTVRFTHPIATTGGTG